MPRPKLIFALVAAATGFVIAISLGNWQTQRGNAKQALQAQADAAERAEPLVIGPSRSSIQNVADALPRKVRVSGVFDSAGTIYLDNRALDRIAGVYVLTPLVIGPNLPAVLIDRGWKARDMQDRARVNVALLPQGTISINGLAVARPSRLLDLGHDREHRVPGLWQNLDYEAYERATGRSVARFVIRQTGDSSNGTADGLRREWPRSGSGVDTHRGYAFQWYSLAALIGAIAIVLGIKQWRRQ